MTMTIDVKDETQLFGEVAWCKSVKASEGENVQFKLNSFRNSQPVKLTQDWTDVS